MTRWEFIQERGMVVANDARLGGVEWDTVATVHYSWAGDPKDYGSQTTPLEILNRGNLLAAAPELLDLVEKLLAIVDEDLLPNIGGLALQDYARLNDVPLAARRLLSLLEKP